MPVLGKVTVLGQMPVLGQVTLLIQVPVFRQVPVLGQVPVLTDFSALRLFGPGFQRLFDPRDFSARIFFRGFYCNNLLIY